jgi:Protein of unknown function (DUF1360)
MTPFYWLVIGILVTWRITHLLVIEPGPWDIFGRLRRAAGSSVLAELVNCFYCFSLWVAAPLAFVLAARWRDRLLLWLAFSAGAILLERVTTHSEPAQPPVFFEDKEDSHVLRS